MPRDRYHWLGERAGHGMALAKLPSIVGTIAPATGVRLRLVVSYRPTAWASAIFGVSALLLAFTLVTSPLAGRGLLSLIVFTLGLGGESNVGAWWSGMLFFVAGVFALDSAADTARAATERRGWAALTMALMLLSLDEVAWLHEWLSARGRPYLLMSLGMLGLGLVGYALAQLYRARMPVRTLLLGFALLATVPLQAIYQATHVSTNPWVYGALTSLEEGTEIAGALVLLAVTSGSVRRLEAISPELFVGFVRFGVPLLWLCTAALPLAVAATYALNLTGATNWLGATLFMSCALLACRALAQGDTTALAKAATYLLASLGAIAVRPDWDPVVLGHHVNVRGLYFGGLLLTAAWMLSPGAPWRQRAFWLALAGTTLLAAFVLLRPQLVWSTWPPTVALLCFFIELTGAVRLHVGSAGEKRLELVSAPRPSQNVRRPRRDG